MHHQRHRQHNQPVKQKNVVVGEMISNFWCHALPCPLVSVTFGDFRSLLLKMEVVHFWFHILLFYWLSDDRYTIWKCCSASFQVGAALKCSICHQLWEVFILFRSKIIYLIIWTSNNYFVLLFDSIGVGYGQVMSTGFVATYYVTIMAITLHYFYNSFKLTLPWSVCADDWLSYCTPSNGGQSNITANTSAQTSAELYYKWVYDIFFSFFETDFCTNDIDLHFLISYFLLYMFTKYY